MIRLALAAALSTLAIAIASQTSDASEVRATIMEYKNDGAYAARFYIRYNLENGNNCWVKPQQVSPYVGTGGSLRFVLHDQMQVFRGPNSCLDDYQQIPPGMEVWGTVVIDLGEAPSCKKSKRVIFRPSGGTIKYRTKGTITDTNRCRVTQWPDE